ncbi:MAG: serine/threonine protein kinase [Phycisphaerales bacterium]|nr:MAG: serine/threonine protein kinase [Phycisphaerales bacterium]
MNMPTEIGGYQIQRVLGSGGMATVYAALQKQPRRTVALKVMKAGIDADSALHRFKREVEILGRLRHPFIAQVYDAGVHDDGTSIVPYFVMEYVPGAKTILEFAAAKDLNTRDRLKLFVKVCAAIEHGHQHKVIHRDLKPDNLLIDERGEVKVIDYGVARAMETGLTGQTMQTEAGRLVGTVQYMSPEQVEATPQDIDSRCDVYSLGAVLYKLLTGQLPHDFEGMPLFEATRMIREEMPVKPSTHKPELHGDVETIILKSLAKDRRHRYRNAGSLGRDLVRYLAHKPIHARRASVAHRLRLFSRRNRTSLIAAGVIVVVMMIAAGIVLIVSHQSRQRERLSERLEEQLEERDTALEQARAALQEQAAAAEEQAAAQDESYLLSGHTAVVRRIAFHPTSGLLASAAGGEDHSIALWDLQSREVLRRLDEHDAPVRHLLFSADGETLLSAADDGTIVVLEARTGAFRARIRHDCGHLTCLDISPDGRRIALGAEDLTLRVRPVEGEEERTIRGTRGGFLSVAFNADGSQLIGGTERDLVYVWDAETGLVLHTLDGLRGRVVGVAISADNTRALAVAEDGAGMHWKLNEPEAAGESIVACPETVRFVGVDPTGRMMICASDHWAGFWDINTGGKLRDALRPGPLLHAAAISSDGQWYALGGTAGDIYMRPLNAGQ